MGDYHDSPSCKGEDSHSENKNPRARKWMASFFLPFIDSINCKKLMDGKERSFRKLAKMKKKSLVQSSSFSVHSVKVVMKIFKV